MGLTEEQVFQRVTRELTNRGYDFLVHCTYDSIRTKYQTHAFVIANGIPDIIGLAPDNSVIAVEVKGDADIKKGIGQALEYKAGAHASYLAADATVLDDYVERIQSHGLGAISVTDSGVKGWKEPSPTENKTALPETRAQLIARLSGVESFTKIASLDLAHPANFIAPALFLEYESSHWGSMTRNDFLEQFQHTSHLEEGAIPKVVEGATALNLIELRPQVALTNQGRLGLLVLKEYEIDSLGGLESLKRRTSHSETVQSKAPLLATWLLDQYRKHPDFEALYRTLQSFESGEAVPLTTLSARLIRDHPNTFLQLFCTTDSRERARKFLIEGRQEEIYEELDVFRKVIRQNLFQNFARQLQHIGVLSSQTASTTLPLEEYVPSSNPWIMPSKEIQTRFGFL